MYLEQLIDCQIAKLETREYERKIAQQWRFRHLKSKGRKALAAVLASTIAFFVQ